MWIGSYKLLDNVAKFDKAQDIRYQREAQRELGVGKHESSRRQMYESIWGGKKRMQHQQVMKNGTEKTTNYNGKV